MSWNRASKWVRTGRASGRIRSVGENKASEWVGTRRASELEQVGRVSHGVRLGGNLMGEWVGTGRPSRLELVRQVGGTGRSSGLEQGHRVCVNWLGECVEQGDCVGGSRAVVWVRTGQ